MRNGGSKRDDDDEKKNNFQSCQQRTYTHTHTILHAANNALHGLKKSKQINLQIDNFFLLLYRYDNRKK